MKEIKAIIKPNMLDPVVDALMTIPELPGLTVSQIEGFGRQRGGSAGAHEGQYAFVRKTKLEIVVRDEMADRVVDAILLAAHTGQPGDGKIFVVEVEDAVRIRTGDRNNGAL